MSKRKKLAAQKKPSRRARRRKYLSIAAMVLIATLGFAASRYPWRNLPSARSVVPLTAPVSPPTIPPANNPSKEYIYAGSKLIAIEAPKSDQTITFNPLADKTYGDAPFALSAIASSGLSVSFTITSGPATVSGSTLTINGAGSVSVRADQAGNDSFKPAQSVTQSFTVAKATATVTLTNLTQTYDGAAHYASATTTPANLNVNFSYSQGGTNVSTPTNAGSYSVTATVNDNNYQGNASATLTINKATATLSLNSSTLNQTYDGNPKSVTATSNPAGLSTVTITYDGSTTAPTNAGTCAAVASLSNANYQAANATGTLTIAKATQTITFNALADKTYGDTPFTVSASSSSGLSVSFSIVSGPATISGSTVTITGAGTVTVRAAQAGNANYNAAADVDRSFAVAKAAATITLSNLNQTYNASPKPATATTNPAGLSGVSITYNNSSTAPTNAGSYSVVASLTNDNYMAGNVTDTLVIAKATPVISWSNPADILYGTALGSSQLNAAALFNGSSLAGVFGYSPGPGTALNIGNNQLLSVTFTPTDSANFSNATSSVHINVTGLRTNVALAANGATATASSTLDNGRLPLAAINGDRKGIHWGSDPATGSGWHDATNGVYPDWLQIDFNGSKTIYEVDIFTIQDNYSNPIEPSSDMTFGVYGVTAFDVQYWAGSSWVTVPNGSVTGNNKVWCQFSFPGITTNKIRVLVNSSLAGYSRIVEVEAWARVNVALAANGATATASSTLDDGRLPVAAINGDRNGVHWGTDPSTGSGWHDLTNGVYPDWLQVDFNGSKTIDEIDVFSVQDNYGNPVEPTSTLTFTQFGITDFQVQYWNGFAWTEVTGSNVTGNNLIWFRVNFAQITTTKVRVVISNTPAGPYSYSRIVELEAWGAP